MKILRNFHNFSFFEIVKSEIKFLRKSRDFFSLKKQYFSWGLDFSRDFSMPLSPSCPWSQVSARYPPLISSEKHITSVNLSNLSNSSNFSQKILRNFHFLFFFFEIVNLQSRDFFFKILEFIGDFSSGFPEVYSLRFFSNVAKNNCFSLKDLPKKNLVKLSMTFSYFFFEIVKFE